MTGVEGLEARRRPGERGRVHFRAQRNRRVAGGEGGLHRCREFGFLQFRPVSCPRHAERFARDVEHAALGDPRPEHVRGRADAGGEVDAEPGHRGLQLRTRLGLERELRIDRARDAGGEQRLLVGLRQVPERGEGLAVVLDLHPVECKAGAVLQHRLARRPVRERLVVHALVGPVGGLAERDVERVRGVAHAEHRARRLEDGKIERGGEVLGQMGLDQRATDRAEVVRQPDADAGILPRLGRGVLPERAGRGDRRSADMAGGIGCLPGVRHVLGLHEARDEVDVPVPADGDDASGDGEVFAAELGAGLHGLVDFLQARLDGYGLRFKLGAPVVVIERLKLVQPCLELRDFRALLFGRFRGFRIQPPVGRGVLPRDFGHGEGPLPAARELVGGRLEPVHGEPVQEHRILEPDAAGIVIGEEVPQAGPAGGLVGVDADEPGDGRHARHAFLGQEAMHVPGGYVVALGGDLLPDRQLALAVGGDGEGLQDLEIDLVGPVGVQQLGRRVSEAEPLLDGPFGRPEPGGDGGDRLPGRGQLAEGLDLVGRMHGYADDVLGERDLFGIAVPGTNQARHGMVGIDLPFGGQGLQGREATSACDHGMALGAVVAGFGGADNEVLEQAERGDRRLDLRIGEGVGRGLPDVLGGEAEQAQRDFPDGWSGHGSESIHCCLHGELRLSGGAPLSGPPWPHPSPAPLRLRPASGRLGGDDARDCRRESVRKAAGRGADPRASRGCRSGRGAARPWATACGRCGAPGRRSDRRAGAAAWRR